MRLIERRSLLVLLLALVGATLGAAQDIKVFTARKIVTMNPSQPEATAVAVRRDRVVSVGTLASLEPWLRGHEHEIDRSFDDKVLLPGLIDNHLHPNLAAIVTPMHWVTPHPWKLVTGNVEGVRGRRAFLSRLAELDSALGDNREWLLTWGYHQLFHGEIDRGDLDRISLERPIVAWHRSFHEIYLNSVALETLEMTAEQFTNHPAIDFEKGHFFETGLGAAVGRLSPYLMAPERYLRGLEMTRDIIRAGGITTIADMNFGGVDVDTQWRLLEKAWDNEDTPF